MRTVGNVMRERREGRGMTLHEVARRARCSIATISAYETGAAAASRMSPALLNRVAKVLGLRATSLTYRMFWQLRPKGVNQEGMARFLGDLAREDRLAAQIAQLKKKAAV